MTISTPSFLSKLNFNLYPVLGMALLLAAFAGCESSTVTDTDADPQPESITATLSAMHGADHAELKSTLAQIRSATEAYHDVDKAEAEGYHQESPFVPGMGYHYPNFGLMDGEVDIMRPEALVYVDNPADDSKRRLVAVEYVIPDAIIEEKSNLPDLFSGDRDHWHHEDEINAWTLHVWLWYPNPEGIFHGTNPRVGTGS